MIVSRGLGQGGSGTIVGWGMGLRVAITERVKSILTYIRTFPAQTFLQSISKETTVTKRGG